MNNEHPNQEDRIEQMLEKAREEGREEIKELVDSYLKGIEDTMESIREQNREVDITQFLPPLRIFLMISIDLHQRRSSIQQAAYSYLQTRGIGEQTHNS